MRIKAAISPCPNDVFIFAGILSGAVKRDGWDFEFDYQDVETLNRGAQAGTWDLVKISYANFPNVEAGYRLLSCGGALGRGCGPLLLSNRAAPWNPAAPVLVPGRHTTANFLLDFFAEGKTLRKIFLPFDELYRRLLGPEPAQGVVIHEMRFTYAGDGLHLLRDLGAHWESETRHPIPLGACALRRDAAAPAREIEALIRASLDWSYAHEKDALDLCRQHSQSMSDAVMKSHIDLYVNGFSRELGRDGEEAVEFFLWKLRNFG